MSEKRFKLWRTIDIDGHTDEWGVIDIFQDDIDYEEYLYDEDEVVDLLNEQQATIEAKDKEIEEWEFSFRTEMAHHRVAEKELQEKIREKQATIELLKKEGICLSSIFEEQIKENEQLRQSVNYWQKKYEEGTETFVSEKLNELYEENKRLKEELNDCEKFRYTVFEEIEKKVMNDE